MSTPKTYAEWLETAPIEEIVKGLYERIEAQQLEIQALQQENEELKTSVKTHDGQIKNNKMSIVAHKHAETTGECTIPAAVVMPIE